MFACTFYIWFAGSYYVYDNPAALQDVMISDLHIDTQQFTNLYAVYSYPNVILCCFGGFLIDRVFGIRLGALLFCLLVTIGQVSSLAASSYVIDVGNTHCVQFNLILSDVNCLRKNAMC